MVLRTLTLSVIHLLDVAVPLAVLKWLVCMNFQDGTTKMRLIYGNRKMDDVSWDISTPAKRSKAFLKLFKLLRDGWKVYTLDYWGSPMETSKQKMLYDMACKGDGAAAEKLLTMRKKYEYEGFRIEN